LAYWYCNCWLLMMANDDADGANNANAQHNRSNIPITEVMMR